MDSGASEFANTNSFGFVFPRTIAGPNFVHNNAPDASTILHNVKDFVKLLPEPNAT